LQTGNQFEVVDDAQRRARDAAELAPGPEDMSRLAYAGKLMPSSQQVLFLDGSWAFATRPIARGSRVRALPPGARELRDVAIHSRGAAFDLPDYVSRNRVAGLLITHRGGVVFEHYDLGLSLDTRWISMSVAKSVSTTLAGAAIQDGFIGGVEDPLTDYLPELKGSSYEGVSVRQLLQMTSGVKWDDTHTDPGSERWHMLELQIAQRSGAILDFVAHLPRVAPAGSVWNYSTAETHVVGALVQATTGRWLCDYLSEKIWAPFGMQSDATWWLESPDGLEVAGSGIHATLRDYARFGLFLMNDGLIDGKRVLPERWVAQATAPLRIAGKRVDYGYMWWPVPDRDGSLRDGAFGARGIFGQFIYVNPRAEVVIAVCSSRSKPKFAEAIVDNDFFNSVVAALR
jgi:CubicO group peptidase (beta-lactamase class C family)